MEKEVQSQFQKMIDKKAVVTEVVRMTEFNQTLDTDVVMVEVFGKQVFITREELGAKAVTGSLVNFIGKTIKLEIVGLDEEKDLILGSCKQFKVKEMEKLVEDLKDPEKSIKAKVVSMLKYGAYVQIGENSALLLNKDFSDDYTIVSDVLKVGDLVEVEYEHMTENYSLRVHAKHKYETKATISIDNLQPQQVVLGTVRNVKPWGAFVCVAPGIDALCPVPANQDVREGDKVTFKISQVRAQEGKVRGKILRVHELIEEEPVLQ